MLAWAAPASAVNDGYFRYDGTYCGPDQVVIVHIHTSGANVTVGANYTTRNPWDGGVGFRFTGWKTGAHNSWSTGNRYVGSYDTFVKAGSPGRITGRSLTCA